MGYSDNDFLSNRNKETDAEIKELNPQPGQWVNFKGEFGDVWHEIDRVYIPEDYYGTLYVYCPKDSKSKEVKVEGYYMYHVRKISETLPDDARCIFGKEGASSPRRTN